MRAVSREENLAACIDELVGTTVVNGGGCHEADSGVTVLVVVVVDEPTAEQTGRLRQNQTGWETRGSTSAS